MASLQCDTFASAGDARMYFINATLNSFESSSVAIHSQDSFNFMKVDDNGISVHKYVICRDEQFA